MGQNHKTEVAMTIDETLKETNELLQAMISNPTNAAWHRAKAMLLLSTWPHYEIIRMRRILEEYERSYELWTQELN